MSVHKFRRLSYAMGVGAIPTQRVYQLVDSCKHKLGMTL